MKHLIQNLGLIIFMIAIGLLVFSLTRDMGNNVLLITSGGLILLGLVVHVILNKTFE
jgi:hypothetical protein